MRNPPLGPNPIHWESICLLGVSCIPQPQFPQNIHKIIITKNWIKININPHIKGGRGGWGSDTPLGPNPIQWESTCLLDGSHTPHPHSLPNIHTSIIIKHLDQDHQGLKGEGGMSAGSPTGAWSHSKGKYLPSQRIMHPSPPIPWHKQQTKKQQQNYTRIIFQHN